MKKISFIIYKKNDIKYKKLIISLSFLNIPDNVFVNVVTLTGEGSIASIYNEGINVSKDADYRIYVDENIKILEKNLISKVVGIFDNDSKIGIMGCIGTTAISLTGGFLEKSGKVKINENEKIYDEFLEKYKEVIAVSGVLMVTRGNILWREDLFKGNGFWDIAQCIEYKRSGYKIVIPQQNNCWIQTDEIKTNIEEKSRKEFLDEYSKDIFPLVTVIIPTYNRPKYFKIALDSVINQTYKNLDIFITDNSTNNLTEDLMNEYLARDKRIKYIHHKNYAAIDNWNCARKYNNPKAEYVNWLMDDDVFHPKKIEIMMGYYLNNNGISLVTSYRKRIDKDGNEIRDIETTKQLSNVLKRYNGISVGRMILCNFDNIIGEPTTVLIKKKFLKNNNLGWEKDAGKYNVPDFPTWLNLLSKGDMIYIPEALSYFRCHAGQRQFQPMVQIYCIICWLIQAQYAINNRIFLLEEKDIRTTLFTGTMFVINGLKILENINEYRTEREMLENILQSIGNAFFNGYILDFSIDINNEEQKKCACCGQRVEEYLPLPDYYLEQYKKYNVTAKVRPEMLNKYAYTCPKCGATDRERAYAAWMIREIPSNKKIRILDIAPVRSLQKFILKNYPLAEYRTGDFLRDDVDYKLDIMNMYQIEDESIDFFICSHVLEHVSDDLKAMREFKRILKKDGKGILVAPINLNQKHIEEDPDCTDVGERWRRFGQEDHIRRYSKQGYMERLKMAGLEVQEYTKKDFGRKVMQENDLSDTSTIYIVGKGK
ncbi:glycosyltransferase [Pectinatus brassicae]|uniref:Glycosyltransferase involved in cell wall biosynthesis n=1 Tax=Pectinatus brassicae TaxID=862415 RepID=A0A840URS0_9FIRM|nr:glycosyltransferase [Pectinatus brassicae]MBB5336842.1 glycosyltransferase involved in cell wall biosynthesis [Pectinatus brassicae]